PTARPRPHQARARTSRDRETRQQSPRNQGRALGRAGLPGLDRTDRHGRPGASQPPGSLEGPWWGRERAGARAGRSIRLASAGHGERPPSGRLLPFGPYRALDDSWRGAPMTRGAHAPGCPWGGLPAPRVHPPLLAIACAIGPMDPQGGRTGLFDLAGAWLSLPPAIPLCRCKGGACALLGHRRLWPLPDFPPHPPPGTRAGVHATEGWSSYAARVVIWPGPIPAFG